MPIDLDSGSKQMHFRIDSIIEDQYGLWIMDHKTHGAQNNWQHTTWTKQWYTNFQMGLYTHVLYCLYDPDLIKGAMINALEVKKPTKADLAEGRLVGGQFERIPIDRTPEMMQVWLYDADGVPIVRDGGSLVGSARGKCTRLRYFYLTEKTDKVTIELRYWKNAREVKIPVDITSGLGF